jgi:hypothetical protein
MPVPILVPDPAAFRPEYKMRMELLRNSIGIPIPVKITAVDRPCQNLELTYKKYTIF